MNDLLYSDNVGKKSIPILSDDQAINRKEYVQREPWKLPLYRN